MVKKWDPNAYCWTRIARSRSRMAHAMLITFEQQPLSSRAPSTKPSRSSSKQPATSRHRRSSASAKHRTVETILNQGSSNLQPSKTASVPAAFSRSFAAAPRTTLLSLRTAPILGGRVLCTDRPRRRTANMRIS